MKKYLLIITILLCFSLNKPLAQTDPAYDSIKVLNLDYYASKPVDSLLHAIPQSYNFMHVYGDLNFNNKAIGLAIRYPSGMLIMIKPKKFVYMNRIDPNNNWDISLFKKETASNIMVIHPDFNSLFGQYP